MSKRVSDQYDFLSTPEIKVARLDNQKEKENWIRPAKPASVDWSDWLPMDASKIRDYILNTKSFEEMMAKAWNLELLQIDMSKETLYLCRIHGQLKFFDKGCLKTTMDEAFKECGQSFYHKIIIHAAEYVVNAPSWQLVSYWKNLREVRPDVNWKSGIHNCYKDYPHLSMHLLVLEMLLYPDGKAEDYFRILPFLNNLGSNPPCLTWVFSIIRKFPDSASIDHSALENITRRALVDIFNELRFNQNDNYEQSQLEKNQSDYAKRASNFLIFALKIISPDHAPFPLGLIENPKIKLEAPPCYLLALFYVHYLILGCFSFEDKNKLIAWHFYYDDRWCGYNRQDLFGNDVEIHQEERFTHNFKFVEKIVEHPHCTNFTIAARTFEWIVRNEDIYLDLINRYGDEQFIQYLCLSFAFSAHYDQIIRLYDDFKDHMKTEEGFMCLHISYMYSCARKALATEAMLAWARVMQKATFWSRIGVKGESYLEELPVEKDEFPLPFFVPVANSGEFATRLLRNTLWTTACNEGLPGWKKYGTLIIFLCESLADSFVNYNMVRIIFQKITTNEIFQVFGRDFVHYIHRVSTYEFVLNLLSQKDLFLLQHLKQENFLPTMRLFKRDWGMPCFKYPYMKFMSGDSVFSVFKNKIPDDLRINLAEKEAERMEAARQKRIMSMESDESISVLASSAEVHSNHFSHSTFRMHHYEDKDDDVFETVNNGDNHEEVDDIRSYAEDLLLPYTPSRSIKAYAPENVLHDLFKNRSRESIERENGYANSVTHSKNDEGDKKNDEIDKTDGVEQKDETDGVEQKDETDVVEQKDETEKPTENSEVDEGDNIDNVADDEDFADTSMEEEPIMKKKKRVCVTDDELDESIDEPESQSDVTEQEDNI